MIDIPYIHMYEILKEEKGDYTKIMKSQYFVLY